VPFSFWYEVDPSGLDRSNDVDSWLR
jgi:hypothetical protein